MSIWSEHNVEELVTRVLEAVPPNAHTFGRPYLSVYQLAIAVNELHPQLAQVLGVQVGGVGTGQRTSLAQYLARELSRQIGTDSEYPVEGASLSNDDVLTQSFAGPDGPVASSLIDAGYALTLFRVRPYFAGGRWRSERWAASPGGVQS